MQPHSVQLIVGLGNPGPKYDQTRHNAGFWFVERIAEKYNGRFLAEAKFSGEVAQVQIAGQKIWLLKPGTFMNRSGQSVSQFSRFYKLSDPQILIAHDELDLDPGVVKLKKGGGHGGHNGLRDVIAHLGKDFWRLRLGIGHPGHKDQVVDFVLNRPSREEEDRIAESIDKAVAVLPEIIENGPEKAMNRLHT